MRFADFVQINPKVTLKRNLSHPCVMMEDIVPGNRYVSSPRTKEFKGGAVFESGDTLFARITPCLENGKIAQYVGEPAFGSTEFIVFRGKSEISDNNFIFYLALTDIIRKPAEKSMFGASGRQRADLTAISEIEVPFIAFPLQLKIASILSAYDDLIENNTRRIRILEEMAQAIYREWFVNFRFPGYEGVRLVESPLGLIPEGWEIGKLSQVYDTGSGGTPGRQHPEYYEGDIYWLKTKELVDGFIFDTDEKISELGLRNSSAKVFPEKTVIMAMYGATIGKLGILSKPSTTNQACCAILPRVDSIYSYAYIYFFLLHNRQKIINLRMGAAQQNISQFVIRNLEILKPKAEVVEKFNGVIFSLLDLIENLQIKNHNLRQQRDVLLPKLMSERVIDND